MQTTRLPKLLYSYLASEMLAPFFASFVVMNLSFFLVRLLPFLNVVLELEIGFSDFIRFFCYLFPNMFLYSIPMAAMMGVVISFIRLSTDGEILALKASGVSLYQMLPPVIMVALVIALLNAYFSIHILPKAELAMKQLMFQVAKEKIDKGIKEQQFTEALGDLVVYVESVDKESGEWRNVWVSDMRGQVQPIITMAQTGNMEADIQTMMVTIKLYNGSSHKPDGKRSQIVTFDHYTLNIPLQTPTMLQGGDVTQHSPSTMTLEQLYQAADRLGSNHEKGKVLMIHYHKRITLPVGCFILSLLSMPLGMQSGHGRKAIGIPLGLGFFFLYYVFFTIGKTLAEDNILPVAIAMWLPNSVFFCLTLYFLRQTAKERSILPASVEQLFATIQNRFFLPASTLFRKAGHLTDD